jgi:hypothetical protein
MTKRPPSITVLSWLCVVVGVCGVSFLLFWMTWDDPLTVRYILPGSWYSDLHPHAMWLFPAQWFFLALCGVFMLRGFNWARWILVAWVGYHFFQSLAHIRFELMFEVFYDAHSPWELLAHSLLYVMILYAAFHPVAGRYFRGAREAV